MAPGRPRKPRGPGAATPGGCDPLPSALLDPDPAPPVLTSPGSLDPLTLCPPTALTLRGGRREEQQEQRSAAECRSPARRRPADSAGRHGRCSLDGGSLSPSSSGLAPPRTQARRLRPEEQHAGSGRGDSQATAQQGPRPSPSGLLPAVRDPASGARLSAPARQESGRPRDPCDPVRLRDSKGWFGCGAPAALAHNGCSSFPGVRKWLRFLDWSRRKCRTSALGPHSRPDTQILACPSPPRGSAAAGPLLGGLQAAAPAPTASRNDKKICIARVQLLSCV